MGLALPYCPQHAVRNLQYCTIYNKYSSNKLLLSRFERDREIDRTEGLTAMANLTLLTKSKSLIIKNMHRIEPYVSHPQDQVAEKKKEKRRRNFFETPRRESRGPYWTA